MRVRTQKNLDYFVCIGAGCEDTCCKGWKIGIDRESYERYRRVRGEFGRRLFWNIDHKNRCFRLKGQACAFLNQDGFCDIYKEMGRKGMCRECRVYPRHVEDYGTVRERMLSLSCPEAARVILEDEDQGVWEEKIRDDISGNPEDIADEKFLSDLEQLRDVTGCLLKDRSIEWGQRLAMILALAHDIQNPKNWEKERTVHIQAVSERYLAWGAAERFQKKLRRIRGMGSPGERMIRMAAWMRLMKDMEPVLPGWSGKLEKMCRALYHKRGVKEYSRLLENFHRQAAALEKEWENLTLYFINTCFLGAVYDGDVYGKVQFAVFGVLMIREWCLFRYGVCGRITKKELADAAYRYSRQVENSENNLQFLEREFLRNRLFGLEEMMTVCTFCTGENGR